MQILSPSLPKSGIFYISQDWQQQYGYGHSPFESSKSLAGTAKASSEKKASLYALLAPESKDAAPTRHPRAIAPAKINGQHHAWAGPSCRACYGKYL